jgi:hypothetical protein
LRRKICTLTTNNTLGPTASAEAAGTSAAVWIAERFQARRISSGRWVARCPAHADRAPSLTIAEGKDGRALLYCHTGCNLSAILESAGLAMLHLFPAGPRRSAEELAAIRRECEYRGEQQAEGRRRERIRAAQLLWQWQDLKDSADRLARALETMAEDTPCGEQLTACFQLVMDELHSVDRAIPGQEE